MFVQVFDTTPDHQIDAVAALLHRCFHDAVRTEQWLLEHDDRFCSQGDALKRVLAVDVDEVIGYAVAYRRTITYRGRPVVLGGLGDVCTDPGHRRSGVATAVVRTAMDALHAGGCDLAYLCAEVGDPGIVRLYGQVGFVALGRPRTLLGRSGKRYTDMDAMIAPLRSPSVFHDILEDHEPFDVGTGDW